MLSWFCFLISECLYIVKGRKESVRGHLDKKKIGGESKGRTIVHVQIFLVDSFLHIFSSSKQTFTWYYRPSKLLPHPNGSKEKMSRKKEEKTVCNSDWYSGKFSPLLLHSRYKFDVWTVFSTFLLIQSNLEVKWGENWRRREFEVEKKEWRRFSFTLYLLKQVV